MEYIDWAVEQNFGVMDINVPAYVTHEEVCTSRLRFSHFSPLAKSTMQDIDAYTPEFNEKEIQEQILSLVCYLWDNFLQLYETDRIILLGVGNAYLGVKVLLINRGKRSNGRILGIEKAIPTKPRD